MKKFLIIASGIYLILVGTIVTTLFLMALLFLPKKPTSNVVQYEFFKPILGVLFTAFFSWPIISGVGIILKKNWARISVFLISIFSIFVSLCVFLLYIAMPLAQNGNSNYQSGKLFFLGFNLIFFIIIPAFFMIFFSRKSVKDLFVPAEEEGKMSNRPFGITLIAILSLFTGVASCICVFYPNYKMLFGPIILSGKVLIIYLVILAVINLFMGFGLLKLKKPAWLTTISLNIFYILQVVVNFFAVSEQTLSQLTSQLAKSKLSMSLAGYKIIGLTGLVFPIAILVYLVNKKGLFLYSPQGKKLTEGGIYEK